eukprot:scaffold43448_cov199-Amphora_coffeaeformis.AAC.2
MEAEIQTINEQLDTGRVCQRKTRPTGEKRALQLSQVGDHYSKLNPQSIVDSLETQHKSRFLHGDALVDNVMCMDGRPV